MRLPPLKQQAAIEISSWEMDVNFGVFPQGARAKEAYYSPAQPTEQAITPDKRYLLKRSKRSYPDQFWGEIIAYRIGCLLGVDVPPAFAAWNAETGHCGALIEWFYVDGEEVSTLAGDFLQQIQPDFDRDKGTRHNLADIEKLLRAFSMAKILAAGSWHQWWVDALLFDALIGNTDRHQDNWGFLFATGNKHMTARFMPLFDNGTSLGHERFVDRVQHWREADFRRYINKGTHHVAWSLDEPRIKGHLALLERALQEWPATRALAQARINISERDITDAISDLVELDLPVKLTAQRMVFIRALLAYRLDLLREVLA